MSAPAMASPMFGLERHGATTLVRLSHGKASAMDFELLHALRGEFERLSAAPDVRAVVLTGSGPIFSAGVDLKRLLAGGRAYVERFLPEMDAAFLAVFGCDKPVVAAVNGHAIAGGCVLTCAADVRLMAAGPARIGLPELKVGVPFPPAVVEVLRFPLPPQHAQDLLLRGRLCGAEEALARGLIDEIVAPEQLLDRALAIAAELSSGPAESFRLTKRALRGPTLERARAAAGASRAAIVEQWASEGVLVAVRRYVEATLGK